MNFAEILLMVAASCFDAMSVSVSYRISGIQFPFRSITVMTVIHGLAMAFALFAADAVLPFSPQVCVKAGAVIILLIGLMGIAKPIIARAEKKHGGKLETRSRLLAMLIDETKADCDCSNVLSVKECIPLSFAVASDALAVGICAGPSLDTISKLMASGVALPICFVLIILGKTLGGAIRSRVGESNALCYIQGGFLIALGLYMLLVK